MPLLSVSFLKQDPSCPFWPLRPSRRRRPVDVLWPAIRRPIRAPTAAATVDRLHHSTRDRHRRTRQRAAHGRQVWTGLRMRRLRAIINTRRAILRRRRGRPFRVAEQLRRTGKRKFLRWLWLC